MNRIVNDKQCIILCNFDDLKMSHVDAEIFSRIISYIDAE